MLNSNIVFIDNIETEEQAQMLNERLLNMIEYIRYQSI